LALPPLFGALSGFAGLALGLTLIAFACMVFAISTLVRLGRDHRVLEAAERHEAVDLTTVVKKYVSPELQSQKAAEEIAIVKEVIAHRRPRSKRIAIIAGVATLCAALTTTFLIQHSLQAMAAARLAAKHPLNLNVLTTIQGVWGWRADAMLSCAENPQTISLSADHKKIRMHWAKAIWDGQTWFADVEFDVVSTFPNELVLALPDPATPTNPPQFIVHVKFSSADTYSLSRNDQPFGSTGSVVRCR
jgi:hypothetical protein